jgi:hypothetical protein
VPTAAPAYDHRPSHFVHAEDSADGTVSPDADLDRAEHADQELVEHYRIRRDHIAAERSAVQDLRERGEIEDEIWRNIERDLDFEELRMDA